MRAVRIKAFGQPTEVLHLVDLPEPPGPVAGEVLVGVEYLNASRDNFALNTLIGVVSEPAVIGALSANFSASMSGTIWTSSQQPQALLVFRTTSD